MKYKPNSKYISLLLAALLISNTVGCSLVEPNEGDDETKTSQHDQALVSDTYTDSESQPQSEQADQVEYLPIPEITLTQIDSLPKGDSEAIFKVSPIGWDPEFFVFDDGLTLYLRRYYSHKCYITTLTLPEGFSDGQILHVSRGGGSDEVDILVKALNGTNEVYLNYYFSSLNVGEFVTPPQAAMVLEGVYLDHLLDSISSVQSRMESYTVSFPEGQRFTPATSYGDVMPNVEGGTILPSADGVGYVVYGPMKVDMSESDDFITYGVESKDGYIVSVKEVDTITKSAVLTNGQPYKGSLDGNSFCIAHSVGQLIYRSVHITDSEIWLSSYVNETCNGGTFVGTYTYDAAMGDFTAVLKREYVNENGESQTTGDSQKVIGKLYEYNGFIHFICESSETGVLSPDDPLPLTFVYPSGTTDNDTTTDVVEVYNSYELDDFTWNTVEVQDNINVAIKPEDIAREYNEITYNNTSFVIVDTKGSKTFAAIKTKDMYTGFREINPVYSNTIEWQTFDNVLGKDALRLSYAVGANAADICYFTFENGNLDLILTCNKSATTVDDMVLEAYGSMGATMNLYKYENGELLCCNINSELKNIFPDAKQIWLYQGADRQYGSRDLILTVDLSDTSEKYYGWIENGSLHLVNEIDIG